MEVKERLFGGAVFWFCLIVLVYFLGVLFVF